MLDDLLRCLEWQNEVYYEMISFYVVRNLLLLLHRFIARSGYFEQADVLEPRTIVRGVQRSLIWFAPKPVETLLIRIVDLRFFGETRPSLFRLRALSVQQRRKRTTDSPITILLPRMESTPFHSPRVHPKVG